MTKPIAALLTSLVLLLALSRGAQAQEPTSAIGQVIVVDPLPGHAAALEEGAKKHMAWLKGQGATWSWVGFEIIMGERTGQYVWGSFNHAYADFDSPDVDPQASSASIDENIASHVHDATVQLVRLLPDLSMATPGGALSPLYEVMTFKVKPGQDEAFLLWWDKFKEALTETGTEAQYFLYAGAQGTVAGEYVLSVPHESFADMDAPEGWIPRLLTQVHGEADGRRLMEMGGAALESWHTEVFALRPDLSVNLPM